MLQTLEYTVKQTIPFAQAVVRNTILRDIRFASLYSESCATRQKIRDSR